MLTIGDVIELTVDIPDHKLLAGMQGAIVHCHNEDAYEIEFTDDNGETLDFLALRPEQFIVVWHAATQQWVPVVEQVASLTANLPAESAQEILDFARFLSARRQQRV